MSNQVEDEEEEKSGLDEYGVATRSLTRGGRTTTRRGLSRYRQTHRRPRSTIRVNRGSQRLQDDIQLEEIPAKEAAP